MESAVLPVHFTDLRSELLSLEPQQQAASAPARVEQVIPLQGRQVSSDITTQQTNIESPGPHMKSTLATITGFTANKGNIGCREKRFTTIYYLMNSRKQPREWWMPTLLACTCVQRNTHIKVWPNHIFTENLYSVSELCFAKDFSENSSSTMHYDCTIWVITFRQNFRRV